MQPYLINKLTLITLFLTATCFALGQKSYLINGETFVEKKITYTEEDEISFLINATKFEANKPTALYFNGSLPTPLIIEWKDSTLGLMPFHYFNFDSFLDTFNLVLVSKPFVPVCAKVTEIVNGSYVPNIEEPRVLDSNFVKSNNREYLGKRADFLLNYLKEDSIIKSKRILTIGHSQGGLEAVKIARLNKYVTDVVMLAAAPYGRAQHVATNYYLKYLNGEIDFETMQQKQNNMYASISAEYSSKVKNGNMYSFQEYSFDDIINTEANIFYGAGTRDISSFYAGQLVVDGIINGKTNIITKLYENMEHSFFKVEPSGEINYDDDAWQELFDDILIWFSAN